MSDGDGVFWSTKVLDEQSGEWFKIRADGDTIRVFPVDEDFSLGTFARFYEFVVEHIDERAEPVPNPEADADG